MDRYQQAENLQRELFNSNQYLLHHNKGANITNNNDAKMHYEQGLNAQQQLWNEYGVMTFVRTPVRLTNNINAKKD